MLMPNREGLRSISKFAIDAQFIQTYAVNLFKQLGEEEEGNESEEYKSLCAYMKKVVSDTIDDLREIQAEIPVLE